MTKELIDAVIAGDADVVQIVLGSGARVDERYNLEDIIETAGGIPEDKYGLTERVVTFHTTALHQASRMGNVAVLGSLFNASLDSSPIIDIADSDNKKPWQLGRDKECVRLWSEQGAAVRSDLIEKFQTQSSFLKIIHDATPLDSRSDLLSEIGVKVSPKVMGGLNDLIDAVVVPQLQESKRSTVSAVEQNMPAKLIDAVMTRNLLKIGGVLVSDVVDPAGRYNLTAIAETAGGIPESKFGLNDRVEQYHTSALHQASRMGDADILDGLLARSEVINVVDSDGNKPWQLGRDRDCVKLWSEKSSDVRSDLIDKFKDEASYLKNIHDVTPENQRNDLLKEIGGKVNSKVFGRLEKAIEQESIPKQREQSEMLAPALAKTTSTVLDLAQQKGQDQGQSWSK